MGSLVQQAQTFQNWSRPKRPMSVLKWANTKFAYHVIWGTNGNTKTKGGVPSENTAHPNGIVSLRLREVQAGSASTLLFVLVME